MAFSFTKTAEQPHGQLRMTCGKWVGTGVTSGNIYTGLQQVQFVFVMVDNSASPTEQAAVNASLPCSDPIAIAFTSGNSGYWIAFGY